MEQVPDLTNSITITRSFTQERLNRINADPYGTLNRQINYPSAPASERLLNFVKGKFHGALSTVKKLLEGPKQSSNSIPLLPDSQKRLIIPNERLNGISSLIQETISKPEYQEHYDVYNHRHANNKKASFLNLLSYYKDVSADRIREKMEESNSWIIPEPVACPLKPVPSRGTMVPVKSRGGLRKKYSRKASHSSNNSSMVIMNGKRELNSILSSKDKKTKDKKRVSFKPEYQRSTSSMIRYMSSDEEENGMYNEDSTDKKVILEDQSMSKESPTLRLSIIAKRKAKINPFQKKNLAEKLSNSQLLRSEKLAKKPNGGKFYMDNSFISDNHVNDSKLETDSDESNILQPSPEHHNAREPEDFNTNKKIVEVSEESEKGSPKFDAPSLKRIEETGKPSSPSLEDNEIEEQKMEKEEPHPEEKAAPEIVEKPQETKGLFGNLGKTTGSLFGQAPAQGLFGNNKPEEKPSLSRKDSPEVPAQPSLFNLNNSSPKQAENAIPQQVRAPEPEIQEVVTEKPVESENPEEAAKVSYEEALKNPIFANVVSKKDDSVKINNPFLNPTAAPSRGFNSLVSDIVQESAEVPVQEINNAAPAPDNNPFLQRNQSVGILGILQSSQSAAPANTGGLFNNTLKPIGSMSWMNSNNSDQGTKNLFGGLGALSQPQAPAPSQPSIFGQGFSGGMNNEESMMQNTGNSLFNNNSAGSSLFGGGSMQMQGNSGAGLFGGNNLGGGMNTLNQEAMNSNPFLAGLGGGFGGNNQGGGGMMRASSFSLDSGKKRGSQRERAF